MNITINIDECCCKKEGVALATVVFHPIQEQVLPEPPTGEHAVIQLTDTQFVEGTLQITNKKGNPAQVEPGSEKFNTTDPSVVATFEVVDASKGQYKLKVAAAAAGAAHTTFDADADLGDGVQSISIFIEDFSVVSGPATGGTVSFGPPQEQV